MTALVQLFSRRLARARLVEREKEHAALGAEALLVAGRVPAKGSAFRREHDEFSARLGDCVAASLFERAHEGGEPCAAGADSRCGFERGVPSVVALGGGAVSLEGRYDGQAQYFGVAVGEPLAAEKLDRLDALKEAGVGLARPGADGVFANVAAKSGKLAVAERRTPWSIEVVVDRFVKKRRDAPRIELACGDFGLRPRGICFPQSMLVSQSHCQRRAVVHG